MSAKLNKLQSATRTGGKGTPRRAVRTTKSVAIVNNEKKVAPTLRKVGLQAYQMDNVSVALSTGKVMVFKSPRVQANFPAGVFVVFGRPTVSNAADLIDIRSLLDNLKLGGGMGAPAPTFAGAEDEDIPELVDTNFEEVAEEAE
ncbi:hypothetical protein H696_03003 [Fonticula alba]|uniref:Nascent polypeptide-associated complex subunit beta n=1 Tax=Fonticula alba TaxID=691883 RepID=A0A058Z9P8_FONAL|nr:hypothetical protein H696_03003 [Fonticula alba]KCV70648.1 hypothetical protein H696_03003 [Fonticula alba]|eukprot:XP_009495164.1 hypothetical protein H696_03003 [Fonticula alba]